MRLETGTWLVLALGLVVAGAAHADGVGGDRLADTLDQQGQLIAEMRREVSDLRSAQLDRDDRIRALEDELADPLPHVGAGSQAVTADWVDQRIQAFGTADESRFFLSGYGKAEWSDELDGGPSTFNTQFNPIFHFRLTEKLHFNAELEIELEDGGQTEFELEYATIDLLATDWLTLSAGRFLTPFNVFGQKLHPAWINKLATAPILYGHHGGGGLIPVISDVGVMASGGAQLWDSESKFNYALYLTNGPGHPLEEEEEGHHGDEHADEAGPVALEFENTPDENNDKTFGGRFGLLLVPNLELGVSWMTGRTRGENGRFNLVGADLWYAKEGFELRGEFARLSRKSTEDLDRWGYWVQAAYRLDRVFPEASGWRGFLGRLEPVVRWGEIDEPEGREQIAFGVNYWLYPSVPIRFTYEANRGAVRDDRFIAQIAYGF